MGTLRNSAKFIGNLGGDPEVKNLESGKKVANFSLAVDSSYKDKDGNKVEDTTWIPCVAWGKTAELLEQYTKKGSKVAVDTTVTTRNYEKDGNKVYVTEFKVDEIQFLDNK